MPTAVATRPAPKVASINQGRMIRIDDGPKTVSLVQAEIWRMHGDFKKIAEAADLSISTVSNIASGETKLPRLRTIIRILAACGWDIYAQERLS